MRCNRYSSFCWFQFNFLKTWSQPPSLLTIVYPFFQLAIIRLNPSLMGNYLQPTQTRSLLSIQRPSGSSAGNYFPFFFKQRWFSVILAGKWCSKCWNNVGKQAGGQWKWQMVRGSMRGCINSSSIFGKQESIVKQQRILLFCRTISLILLQNVRINHKQSQHTSQETSDSIQKTQSMLNVRSFKLFNIQSMKTILCLLEEYLRKYPSPNKISALPGLFKLNYVYSSPYTDSRHNKQVLYPTSALQVRKTIENPKKEIIYNQKGRIQQSESFDSILIKDKHEKVLQDDVFGKASHNKDFSRWVYVAEVKQEGVKSYFNEGKGKQVYQHDLGQRFDDIREVGIFVWDKTHKKAWRVEIDKEAIPACPSFANDEGTEIIFHAYQRQHFGHGIIHCFNRPVAIFHAQLQLVPKETKDNGKEQKQPKPDEKPELKLNVKVTRIINDKYETNIFPSISPCFNYMVYLSGSGITHTYYLDFVIMKRINYEWVQTHRIPQKFVGYYDTLKNYIIKEGEKSYAISQTLEDTCHQIYKIDLQTGECANLTKSYPNYDFCISDVEQNGLITGTATSTNVNVFFYSDGKEVKVIDPPRSQNFIQKEYREPIHAVYVQAKEQEIHEEFKERAKQRPLLVMPHGGPHGSFVQALTSMRYVLLKMGYALLMPNFSGSAGYGKQHLSGALKNIGEKDSKEIIDLLNIVLADNPQIDKTKIHLQGGSYGGYMSAILGSRYPQYFKSAIILNGVLNIMANLWFTDIPEWNLAQTLGKSSLSNLTQEDYREMWRQSPIGKPMAIPTLQFLGAKDRRVPYRQGLFFDAITKAAGTPITTYVYENSNHGLADSVETSTDIVVKSIVFLEGIKPEEKKE